MNRIFSIIVLNVLFLVTLNVFSGDMTTKQRIAIIKGLKLKGIVGENNKGFLEFRGRKTAKNVVKKENNQRRKNYKAIAEKQGVSTEEVGRQRTLQNANNSPAGTWLQKADGSWFKKE